MSEAPLILGVSGLRGIVGESLTPEVAVRYAGAVGAWFAHQDPYVDTTDIIVGHDGRAGHFNHATNLNFRIERNLFTDEFQLAILQQTPSSP